MKVSGEGRCSGAWEAQNYNRCPQSLGIFSKIPSQRFFFKGA